MRLIKNELGLITTANGQWAIKQDGPDLFLVRERTGPNVWDWRERARCSTNDEAAEALLGLLSGRRARFAGDPLTG